MAQYLRDKSISNEAQSVLNEGQELWQAYFLHTDNHTVRDELKLNRADVGWYQVRNAIKARNASGDFIPVSFAKFEAAYKQHPKKCMIKPPQTLPLHARYSYPNLHYIVQ